MDNNWNHTSHICKRLWFHKYRLHSVDKLYIALQKRRKKKTLDLPEANQHPVRFNSPQQRIKQNRRKEIQKIFTAKKKRMELKIITQMLPSTHSQVKHCTFSGPCDLFYEQTDRQEAVNIFIIILRVKAPRCFVYLMWMKKQAASQRKTVCILKMHTWAYKSPTKLNCNDTNSGMCKMLSTFSCHNTKNNPLKRSSQLLCSKHSGYFLLYNICLKKLII